MLLILLLSWAAGIGCSDKSHVPGGILSKDKMEQVMWDMAQADQYAALYLAKDSAHIDRKAETMRLYAEVFRLHKVTADEFRKSYRYYLDHPELNQLLFDSVIARGVRARTELYDRPGFQYHTPVPPANVARPGIVPGPARPGMVPAVVRPGGGAPAEMMQRMREAAARKHDSIMRATRVKRDTADRKKGRP